MSGGDQDQKCHFEYATTQTQTSTKTISIHYKLWDYFKLDCHVILHGL